MVSLVMLNIITAPGSPIGIDWSGWGLEMTPMLNSSTGEPILDPDSGEPVLVPAQSYDNLILMVSNLYTAHIHQAVYLMMEEGSGMGETAKDALRSLLSTDFNYDTQFNVNASAALVIVYYRVGDLSALEVERHLVDMASEADTDDLVNRVIGWGLVNQQIADSAVQDLMMLFPVVIALVAAFLFWFLRNIGDVLITLTALGMAITWVYGYAAYTGEVLTPLSLAVPFLVVGVGTDFSIHLILRYRQERLEGMDKDVSNRTTMHVVGQALILSTLTTCVAYLSNASSDMSGMIQFGVMNALGLLSAFLIIMLLVPSSLVLRGDPPVLTERRMRMMDLDGLLARLSALVKRRGRSVVAVLAVATLCMGVAAVNVEMDFNPYQFLPRGTPIDEGVGMLLENFPSSGLNEMVVLVEGSADDPDVLQGLQEGLGTLAGVENVIIHGSTASTRSIFNVWHDWAVLDGSEDQRYNASFAALYALHFQFNSSSSVFIDATTSELQEMTEALSGSEMAQEDMARFVSWEDGGLLRLTIAIRDGLSETEMRALESDIYTAFRPLQDAGSTLIVTGDALVSYEVVEVMRDAQMNSVAITLGAALVILTVLGMAMRRHPLLGLFAVLPTAATIVWVWGLSFIFGVTLNPLTMTVAAIAVGLGVDYSIHMSNRYYDLLDEGANDEFAIDETVRHTGKGVLGGAFTTAMGFGVLAFFSMQPITEFGIMVTASVLLSLFMTLFLLSSVLAVWGRRFRI
ncbi:MAG: MMPL family transporter, partial [Candidatus Methanomethylophilaceae archaeon]|nr:MMPL family transporter [Candidatus Methanomethylophilaceae archaeon]